MIRSRRFFLGALLAATFLFRAGPGLTAAPGVADDAAGDSPAGAVTARLVADVVAAAPGEPFTAGIEITMKPGWHTYWENGGDAGIPTTVEWTLPDGWQVDEIRWPVPHRYEEEGDVVTFGYADRVLLPVRITPPAGASTGFKCADTTALPSAKSE